MDGRRRQRYCLQYRKQRFNLSGGVFDISSDGAALVISQIGTFNNQAGATFRKSAGSGTSTVAWAFNNSGTVQAQSGTLRFTSGGAYGGTTTLSGGATVEFNAGTYTLQNGGTVEDLWQTHER